ncbi:hypothetical protein NLC29_01925 [Candidatus Aminicenantes bacterium AH-873-B07]|nr:hypothetical protein [Candidatus Aminicenantes bacterium AH-873-B07]
MRWRFLPIEIARKEVAKLEAEIGLQKEVFLPLIPPEIGKWIKFYNNPIFKPGPPGSWEEKSVDCFTIGFFNGKYMMWYVGTPYNLVCQIGVATSDDGIHWKRYSKNPVLKIGPPGSWDDSILICQSIIFDKDENIYKMWYVGGNSKGVFGIGYATSYDGIHWTKYPGNPVLKVTEPWEGTLLEAQSVVKTFKGYMMWYGALNVKTDRANIGLAISPDGIHWTKYSGNPVFKPGNPKDWDGYSVDTPDVVYKDGMFHMWYMGWKRENGIAWIGHATSYDGIHWQRDPDNPVLITTAVPGAWDSYKLYRPRVMLANEFERNGEIRGLFTDKMWYSGENRALKARIGLALKWKRPERERKIRRKLPNITQDKLSLVVEVEKENLIHIYFFTPWLSRMSLKIYNISGKCIRTLINNEVKIPGFYELIWDGRNKNGLKVPEGIYFCELQTETHLITREIIISK